MTSILSFGDSCYNKQSYTFVDHILVSLVFLVSPWLVLLSFVRQCLRNLPEYMFPAPLKDTVVDQIELHTCSLSVYNEHYMICLHDLVVPFTFKKTQ